MMHRISFLALLLLLGCTEAPVVETPEADRAEPVALPAGPPRVPILNFGTFHMSYTPDATSVEFDERNIDNQEQVREIARELAAFEPTVILVEQPPERNEQLQKNYRAYLNAPDQIYERPSELELIAFELGRAAGTQRIYGIDHRMSYNYNIGEDLVNTIDSTTHDTYYDNPFIYHKGTDVDEDSLSVRELLYLTNTDPYLDFLITVNADILTHAGTEGGFEGADEAAKYYQRNLRMFSNMNRLDLTPQDRVFILMGGSHTAFFRDFISRSPKYRMVNTFDYLKKADSE